MENKAPPAGYDPRKRYERRGSCINCGVCCFGCRCQILTAVVSISAGGTVTLGKDIASECSVHDDIGNADYQARYIARGCKDFPHHPLSTPALCGYYWVEVV